MREAGLAEDTSRDDLARSATRRRSAQGQRQQRVALPRAGATAAIDEIFDQFQSGTLAQRAARMWQARRRRARLARENAVDRQTSIWTAKSCWSMSRDSAPSRSTSDAGCTLRICEAHNDGWTYTLWMTGPLPNRSRRSTPSRSRSASAA